jgi:hypothetical protein
VHTRWRQSPRLISSASSLTGCLPKSLVRGSNAENRRSAPVLLSSLDSLDLSLVPPFRQLFVNADSAAGPSGGRRFVCAPYRDQDEGSRQRPSCGLRLAPVRTPRCTNRWARWVSCFHPPSFRPAGSRRARHEVSSDGQVYRSSTENIEIPPPSWSAISWLLTRWFSGSCRIPPARHDGTRCSSHVSGWPQSNRAGSGTYISVKNVPSLARWSATLRTHRTWPSCVKSGHSALKTMAIGIMNRSS